MKRTGSSTLKLLQNLYNRCGDVHKADTEKQAEFGRMAAEYFGETMHQSFPGYDGYQAQMAVRRFAADAERYFGCEDWIAEFHGDPGPEPDHDSMVEYVAGQGHAADFDINETGDDEHDQALQSLYRRNEDG